MKLAQSLRMLSICLGVASEFKSSILLTASCDASLLWSTSTACKSLFVSLLRDSKRFEQWEEEVLFSFEIKKIFPNFIYELQLEKFINDPETESKKLLKFCDLPWDKKCLEFYKRKD